MTQIKKKKYFNKTKNTKQHFKKNNKNYSNSHLYFSQYKTKKFNIYYYLGKKKPLKPLTTSYLQRNRKLKTGIFFKEPSFKNILYPFNLNLKLINEFLKKK
uniref:Ymf100 n=1 Tax=Phytophthora kernoviae TaxID=325452 RepID=UPI00202900DD|nr:Ymf100 [Phytophthora kernoviae]UXG56230.1 hypothetical protein [Phytophthora kernoviae]DAZ88385.1 TPA_asm: Ymf100 [Phytophthora kernoviae]DAZ88818.1 TPA_asm: Ymf100 [Phytophthora kernoviae]